MDCYYLLISAIKNNQKPKLNTLPQHKQAIIQSIGTLELPTHGCTHETSEHLAGDPGSFPIDDEAYPHRLTGRR